MWKHGGDWTLMDLPGKNATHVSLGSDGTMWAVNKKRAIFRRVAGSWEQLPGACIQVNVANKDNIMSVNEEGSLFEWIDPLGWI